MILQQTEVAECLVYVGVSIVEPHLSQYPRKLIIIGQKHLETYQVRQNKVAPRKFSQFSQQPFGILISNFPDLFFDMFYSAK